MASTYDIDVGASALSLGPPKTFLAILQCLKQPVLQWTWLGALGYLAPGPRLAMFQPQALMPSVCLVNTGIGRGPRGGAGELCGSRAPPSGEEDLQLPGFQLVWGIASWHPHHRRDRRTPEPIRSGPLPRPPSAG